MKTSIVTLMAFPPKWGEAARLPGEARSQTIARAMAVAGAMLFDVGIFFVLRGVDGIRPEMVVGFVETNLTLLGIDLALTWLFLRKRTALSPWVLSFCVVLEMCTCLTWVQLTGVVSSYFLLVAPLLIATYRGMAGYWVALVGTVFVILAHGAIVGLEDAGVLRTAALFVDSPTGLYSIRAFRYVSLASILSLYAFTFFGTNFNANLLRQKDAQLNEARRDFERAVEEGQPGRLVGARIGGYRLIELLGRGGMGEVYEAERASDGAVVALKVLHRHLGYDSQSIARFQREIDVVRRLDVRGVPQVLDAGRSEDGLHYLAMELLRGEDLGALLRRKARLTLDEVLPILDQLAEVLDAAHAAGIVHRDVKPQNVFLASAPGSPAMTVKLLDFGIARLNDSITEPKLTETFALMGTPGYLAPEQISPGFGEVGRATDIFALGAVVYRALTGHAAFEAPHLPAALHAALHAHPTPPSKVVPELPPDVDSVIALALAKRPRHRYARALELAEDLRAARNGSLREAVRTRAREFSAFGSELVSGTIRLEEKG